jgi:hypothetical protein
MNDFPKVPNDRTYNQIPDILTITKRNNEFLQFDSGPGDDSSCRMLNKQNSEFCRLMCFFPLNSAGVYRILREFFHDF